MDNALRCTCGTPMLMRRTTCPTCQEQHVYDSKALSLRVATLEDRPYFCVNRPSRKLSCNWLADFQGNMCYGCRLTATTPILEISSNHNAFRRFEEPKRRLIAALLRIGLLPLYESMQSGALLRFHLKQDRQDNPMLDEEYVMTGHNNGSITMNIRETDRVRIEATKRTFNEKYRTTLGTLRHEVGHYFFMALVVPNSVRLEWFREMFGDEMQDYNVSLHRYYDSKSSKSKVSERYVSAYAASHPYEDWAETWAHYMHMEDALAVSHFIGVNNSFKKPEEDWFSQIMRDWDHIASVMNALSLSMGHEPAYPFRLTAQVTEKIRFVADTILACGGSPFVGHAAEQPTWAQTTQE